VTPRRWLVVVAVVLLTVLAVVALTAVPLEGLRWVYRGTLVAAIVASWYVVFTYHRRSQGLWRVSKWGRNLIGSDTLLSVLLTFYIFAAFIPSRALIYSIGAWMFVLYVWLRIRRAHLMKESQAEGEARAAKRVESDSHGPAK
jgi:hypothetical protein